MTFDKYRLPNGDVVNVDATATKGDLSIDFTLADGTIVRAFKADPVIVYYRVGGSANFEWRSTMLWRDEREAATALAAVRRMGYHAFMASVFAEVPYRYSDSRIATNLRCIECWQTIRDPKVTGAFCDNHYEKIVEQAVDFC